MRPARGLLVGSCSGYSELTLDRKARMITRTKGQGQVRTGQDMNGDSQDKEGQQDKGTRETKDNSPGHTTSGVWNNKHLTTAETNTEEEQGPQLSTRPHTKSKMATPAHTNDAPAHETPHKAHNPNTPITRKAAKRQSRETARSQIPQDRATLRRGHKASSEASCATCRRTTLHVPSLGLFPLVRRFRCLSVITLSFLAYTLGWGRHPQWPSLLPVGGGATRVISLS